MYHVVRPLLALAAAGTALAACAAPPRATSESPPPVAVEDSSAALLRRLQALADETGGTVGLHALHLESGRALSLRGTEAFFMASVTKLPLAVHVLREVERGRIALSDTVAITPAQMSPGRSPIRDAHPQGGQVTVEELLRLAVSESDNTANDALQRLVGGPAAVTRGLEELGIRGIRVDRPYTRLGAEVSTPADASDPRDTATPQAATALLAALWGGRVLNRENTGRLTGWMTRGNNPASRIVAGVPAGTPVGHKTGSWNTADGAARIAVNDVGVVTLPHGRGHLAVALFVRNSPRAFREIDRAMAALTRALFDDFSPDPRLAAAPDPRPGVGAAGNSGRRQRPLRHGVERRAGRRTPPLGRERPAPPRTPRRRHPLAPGPHRRVGRPARPRHPRGRAGAHRPPGARRRRASGHGPRP